ncbi:MAG: ADP/ATP-dependent (S)-NAD(P)H-hydrate dehydratase, partial [Bacteroidota bacterium]
AGTVAASALDAVHARTGKARALLVGCGLGRHGDTDEFVRHLIGSTTLPGVLDADGLNAVAPVIDELDFAGRWVLTPHLGELRRLTGREDLSTASRLELAVEYAACWNAVVLVKGLPSVVAGPDGTAYINPTGGPALATAGAGDVLAGAIAGLQAQGLAPLEAAAAGLYLGGAAADRYAASHDGRSLRAMDVVDGLR